jgi:hypothetical protein
MMLRRGKLKNLLQGHFFAMNFIHNYPGLNPRPGNEKLVSDTGGK